MWLLDIEQSSLVRPSPCMSSAPQDSGSRGHGLRRVYNLTYVTSSSQPNFAHNHPGTPMRLTVDGI
jgi:hypothetical protein